MGVGTFILTQSKGIDSKDDMWFRIETENERRYGNTRVSYLKSVTVKLLGGEVTVLMKKGKKIEVSRLISKLSKNGIKWKAIKFDLLFLFNHSEMPKALFHFTNYYYCQSKSQKYHMSRCFKQYRMKPTVDC